MGITYTSFDTILADMDKTLRYLREHGTQIKESSELGGAIRRSREVIEQWRSQSVPAKYDIHRAVGDLANVHGLTKVILGAVGTSSEVLVLSRLTEITAGNPRILTRTDQSRERDTLFELVCARVCSLFASSVRLEEPDVCCDFQGTRWGFSCKVAYGGPDRVAKAIRSGEKQIERSRVELGIVVVELTNHFRHDKMYGRNHQSDEILSLSDEDLQKALFEQCLTEAAKPFEDAQRRDLKRNPRQWNPRSEGSFTPRIRWGIIRAGGVSWEGASSPGFPDWRRPQKTIS